MSERQSSAQRFAERRRDDRWHRWRRMLAMVGGVVLVGAVVWAIWFSSVLASTKVVIDGETTLKESQIRDAADVPIGRPLARIDVVGIEARVASMERIQAVSVSRSFPHTVRIKVAERVPIAFVKLGGEIRGVDRYGIAFRTFEAAPKDLLEVSVDVTDPRRRQQTLAAVASVVRSIGDAPLRADIQIISASSKDSIVITLTKSRTVTWGSASHAARKLTVLNSLLQISAKEYDVSAPDRPMTRR